MKKRKRRKKAILWGSVIIIFGILFIQQQLIINRLNKQYNEAQELKARLEKTGEELKEELELTQKENYIESAAREKLGLIKEGETLIRDKNKKK